MFKPRSTLRRFVASTVIPPLSVFWDLATRLAKIVPEAWDRVQFRRFWGDGNLSADVYFVMESYDRVALESRFRRDEAIAGRDVLETCAGNTLIEGAFSPQAAAMLTALFLRHAGSTPRIVTDMELSRGRDSTLICYGTSDSNSKTFDIEAGSGDLCQISFNAHGQRAFRLAERLFSVESRDGILYDKAIVLRLTNRYESNRCQVVCAGLSEWGSLAAVYYLTTKWKDLHKRYDSFGQTRDFCVLLEVPFGQFENAREVISAVSWEPQSVPNPVLVSSHV